MGGYSVTSSIKYASTILVDSGIDPVRCSWAAHVPSITNYSHAIVQWNVTVPVGIDEFAYVSLPLPPDYNGESVIVLNGQLVWDENCMPRVPGLIHCINDDSYAYSTLSGAVTGRQVCVSVCTRRVGSVWPLLAVLLCVA